MYKGIWHFVDNYPKTGKAYITARMTDEGKFTDPKIAYFINGGFYADMKSPVSRVEVDIFLEIPEFPYTVGH